MQSYCIIIIIFSHCTFQIYPVMFCRASETNDCFKKNSFCSSSFFLFFFLPLLLLLSPEYTACTPARHMHSTGIWIATLTSPNFSWSLEVLLVFRLPLHISSLPPWHTWQHFDILCAKRQCIFKSTGPVRSTNTNKTACLMEECEETCWWPDPITRKNLAQIVHAPCRWGTVVFLSFSECVMFVCSSFGMYLEAYHVRSNGNWLFKPSMLFRV